MRPLRSRMTAALAPIATLALLACSSAPGDGPSPLDLAAAGGGADKGAFAPGTGSADAGSCAASTMKADGAPLDIIVVIDNSASMGDIMQQVKRNLNAFAESIGSHGLDYHVIVITSRGTGSSYDTLKVCVPPPLGGPNCKDNDPTFHQVDVDVGSHDSLDVLLSTYDGTIDPFDNHGSSVTTAWKNFLRMDAQKIFVEVTDDESLFTNAATFDQRLLQKQPAGMFGTAAKRKYTFHSIVGWQQGTPLLSPTPHCSTATAPGVEYQRLSQLTGGIVESVCKNDYSSVFDRVSQGIAGRLGCDFALPKSSNGVTDPREIVVRFTATGSAPRALTQVTDVAKCEQYSDGWYYDDNAKPSRILLCKSTCGAVASDARGRIDIQVGCAAPSPK